MKCTVEHVTNFPLPDTSHGRSPGIHVSSIIRCIAVEQGILKDEWLEELSLIDVRSMDRLDIVAQLRIHMGLAWEAHYIPLIEGVRKHPGEMKLDGTYMTHDGESLSVIITDSGKPNRVKKIHEVKFTYKSTRTTGDRLEGPSNFMWLCQCKAYCAGAETLYADLHALQVCGNYKMPIQPALNIYHLEFTPEEIEDNWQLLQDYKTLKMSEEELV